MSPRTLRRRSAGFTATEILIVLTIAGILAAIAAPNMANMVRVQRLKTSAFDIFASLTMARSEAVKRNVAVTLTPPGGANSWNMGWTITDANGNVLKQQSELGAVTVAGPTSVVFSGNGRLGGGVVPQFDLSAPYVGAGSYRCIKVDLSGRPVSKEGAC